MSHENLLCKGSNLRIQRKNSRTANPHQKRFPWRFKRSYQCPTKTPRKNGGFLTCQCWGTCQLATCLLGPPSGLEMWSKINWPFAADCENCKTSRTEKKRGGQGISSSTNMGVFVLAFGMLVFTSPQNPKKPLCGLKDTISKGIWRFSRPSTDATNWIFVRVAQLLFNVLKLRIVTSGKWRVIWGVCWRYGEIWNEKYTTYTSLMDKNLWWTWFLCIYTYHNIPIPLILQQKDMVIFFGWGPSEMLRSRSSFQGSLYGEIVAGILLTPWITACFVCVFVVELCQS